MRQRSLISLPLMVVTVLALALGTVTVATGAPSAAAKLTTGKVKKIAKKVVQKQAPTLAVASAATATNATNLDGKPAAVYLDRVAYLAVADATAPGVAVSAITSVLGPLSLTVPAGVGFVHLTGTIGWGGGGANTVAFWIERNTASCSLASPEYNGRAFDAYNGQGSSTIDRVVPVTPGVHTFRLCAVGGASSLVYERTLTAETRAAGATGGATIVKPAPPSGDKPSGSATTR